MSVLFLNSTKKKCGVYQYGKRLFDILRKTDDILYLYEEIENIAEYLKVLTQYMDINAIIYNYHCSTMPWLNHDSIQKVVKNIGIPHESSHTLFDIVCNIDPDTKESGNMYNIPRPIYENVENMLINYMPSTNTINEFINYSEPNVPIFGSFGFGFSNKGFDKIVKLINENFDHAIIKFVIPTAHFDPNGENTVSEMKNRCIAVNTKSTIKLMIIHEFFSTHDILKFLESNTMNIFLYDYMYGRGISSTLDYAMSVKRPLGISDSYMFRHMYSDEICLYKTSINVCLQNSVKYCSKFLNDYSHEKMISKFRFIVSSCLTKSIIPTDVAIEEGVDKLSILENKLK